MPIMLFVVGTVLLTACTPYQSGYYYYSPEFKDVKTFGYDSTEIHSINQ